MIATKLKFKLARLGRCYADQCTNMHNGDTYPGIKSEDKEVHSNAWEKAANITFDKLINLANENGLAVQLYGLYPSFTLKINNQSVNLYD